MNLAKKYLLLPLSLSIYTSYAQIQIAVTTDKNTYAYGDTIKIFVRAINPTSQQITLVWPTCCQANYIFDNFNWFHSGIGCCQAFTTRTVQPYDSVTWNFRYPFWNTTPSPEIGEYKIVGEVFGHGFSDTLTITVAPLLSIKERFGPVESMRLYQNYPNSFNSSTVIRYQLSVTSFVTLKIYNVLGQEVATLVNEEMKPGSYEVTWDADGFPSDVYFYRLQAKDFVETKKLILLR